VLVEEVALALEVDAQFAAAAREGHECRFAPESVCQCALSRMLKRMNSKTKPQTCWQADEQG
jgi:hypothetical protein